MVELSASLPTGPRLLLRRLRQVMAQAGSAQDRLNEVVRSIAANVVSEVCSVYLLRGGRLELFATEGLNPKAVHKTTLRLGEGLVGRIAAEERPLALSDAQADPDFAYRPETGEEMFRSLMGVPIVRAARVVGVLVVQNRTRRQYLEEEIEAMQTIAMILAEMVDGLLLEAGEPGIAGPRRGGPDRLTGSALNAGLAQGLAVLHQPRAVVERHVADDSGAELERLDEALRALRHEIDGLLRAAIPAGGSESREILETYGMFARDRGWIQSMRQAIESGLTAEAAVERVQVDTHARMADIEDPYLRERVHDFDDVANRLIRRLTGHPGSAAFEALPDEAVVVARHMGPAELLDYEGGKLRALILEEGAATSHVIIVAKALQIPVIGSVRDVTDIVDDGDPMIVDADNAQLFVRPGQDVRAAFEKSVSARRARQAEYDALRARPAVSRDGIAISLRINAGLLVDIPHVAETGAEGIGLFRTEFQFMVRATMPNVRAQTDYYCRALAQAEGRPVVFRTLDIGADKVLSYLPRGEEENPALGWRAIRVALDRPVLLRMQLRALLRAAAGRELHVMFPMIAEVEEFIRARAWLDREIARANTLNEALPERLHVGTMLEVPSLVWQLPALLPHVDFVSIGSNDLMQYLFAADRNHPRLMDRYEVLSPPFLSLLRQVIAACDAAGVPLSLCGEAAGRPLEALALLGLGLRTISMSADAIGPVKAMILASDLSALSELMPAFCASPEHSVRAPLEAFARDRGIPI